MFDGSVAGRPFNTARHAVASGGKPENRSDTLIVIEPCSCRVRLVSRWSCRDSNGLYPFLLRADVKNCPILSISHFVLWGLNWHAATWRTVSWERRSTCCQSPPM